MWFVYSWKVCTLYEWTDSKIQGCYMSPYRAMSCKCIESIESYQLSYQIYSSQQVREPCPFDLNWYLILYQWMISMVISDMPTLKYGSC